MNTASKLALGLGVVLCLVGVVLLAKPQKVSQATVSLGATQTSPQHVTNSTNWDTGYFWGNLEVGGATYLDGALNVTGAQIISGSLTANGIVNLGNYLGAGNFYTLGRGSFGTSTQAYTLTATTGGNSSSTFALGSVENGTNSASRCIWNGTNYTVEQYIGATTTITRSLSTTCP